MNATLLMLQSVIKMIKVVSIVLRHILITQSIHLMLQSVQLLFAYIFIVGLFVGSFLNALIDRLATGESLITSTRSHCDSCQKKLGFLDLIPVLSWLMLRGRCRYCQEKIPIQNPLVEIATGILFATLFTHILQKMDLIVSVRFATIVFIFWAVCFAALIVIFVFDLKHFIIPDQTILFIFFGALVYHAALYFSEGKLLWELSPTNYLLSCIFSGLPYVLLILATKGKGMGGGDMKFAFIMGLILGYPRVLVAQYVAFILGGIIAVVLLALRKKHFGQVIPFGPFLIIGTITAFFLGEKVIEIFGNYIYF